ncbi:collagen-binding domain-containing protein [Ligilactobacillus equi]
MEKRCCEWCKKHGRWARGLASGALVLSFCTVARADEFSFNIPSEQCEEEVKSQVVSDTQTFNTEERVSENKEVTLTEIDAAKQDFTEKTQQNILQEAGAFHIFSNQTTLTADTNGNIATKDLEAKVDFGTRGDSPNVTTNDYYYIQKISSLTSSASFRNGGTVILGDGVEFSKDESGQVWLNGVKLDHIGNQVYQESAGQEWLNFEEIFTRLEELSRDSQAQSNTVGVKQDFTDENNRYLDLEQVQDETIYFNVSIDEVMRDRPLTIKNLRPNQTTIINVTGLQADKTYEIRSEIKLLYQGSSSCINNGENHQNRNVLLWNFGTANATLNFNCGRFLGSILLPQGTINAYVNLDGNLIADTVNVLGGETHRWDLNPEKAEIPEEETPTNPGDTPSVPSEEETPTDPGDTPSVPSEEETPTDPGDTPSVPSEEETPTNPGDTPSIPSEEETPTDPGDTPSAPSEEETPTDPGDTPSVPSEEETPTDSGDTPSVPSEEETPTDPGDTPSVPSEEETPTDSGDTPLTFTDYHVVEITNKDKLEQSNINDDNEEAYFVPNLSQKKGVAAKELPQLGEVKWTYLLGMLLVSLGGLWGMFTRKKKYKE